MSDEKAIARGEHFAKFSPHCGENSLYPADEFAAQDDALFAQVSQLIGESHVRVSATVNAEMTELYWQVGDAINQDLLGGKRAEYGGQILRKLSERLTRGYGRGWSVQQLWHCRRLANAFPHDEIFSALRRELSWTIIKALMYIDDPLKRDFYIEMCKLNGWSSRTLEGRIKSMLYERTAGRAVRGVFRGREGGRAAGKSCPPTPERGRMTA